MESIGNRISRLRRQANMTQEALAEKLGVSSQAVSKWENDLSCPDISLLPELAKILGTTTDALLAGKNGSVTFSVCCRVPVIVPTADVEDLQEEVFVIWIAIALPPECFDLVVQSFDLSG